MSVGKDFLHPLIDATMPVTTRKAIIFLPTIDFWKRTLTESLESLLYSTANDLAFVLNRANRYLEETLRSMHISLVSDRYLLDSRELERSSPMHHD